MVNVQYFTGVLRGGRECVGVIFLLRFSSPMRPNSTGVLLLII